MKANGVGAGFRRRSLAEGERLVSEYKQSGLGRKEFCAAHGLSVHTLDAWRRRVALPGNREEIVPVEIVEDRAARQGLMRAGSVEPSGQFRVVLADGLRVEVEPGFDAAELRRLIAVLDGLPLRNVLRPPV
jgi:transposase-like protein